MEFVLMPDNYDGSVSLEATFRSGTKLSVSGRADPRPGRCLLADPNFEKVTLSASENTATFTGTAADGTALTAIYLAQPDANVAIGLVAAGDDLPRIIHWVAR